MADGWEVARGGDAARRWLQSHNAAEMRGDANGASAIAAHASCGTERRDCRGLASARAARTALVVVRISGSSGDEIVGFIVGEKFGAVCFAQDHRAGGAQSGCARRIRGGLVTKAQAAARQCWNPCDIEAVLNRYWDAVKRSDQLTAMLARFRCRGRLARLVCQHDDEGA